MWDKLTDARLIFWVGWVWVFVTTDWRVHVSVYLFIYIYIYIKSSKIIRLSLVPVIETT